MGSKPSPSQPSPRVPKTAWRFLDEVLVECPRCGGCAVIKKDLRKENRSGLVCAMCGYAPETLPALEDRFSTYLVQGLDPFYGLPLWLRESVGRRIVWAYNWRHLEDLEFFLGPNWRMHRHRIDGTEARWSYRNRLPKWMYDTKNRGRIAQALRAIRRKRL